MFRSSGLITVGSVSNQSRPKKENIGVSMSPTLKAQIEEEVNDPLSTYQGNFSAWVVSACVEKLRRSIAKSAKAPRKKR